MVKNHVESTPLARISDDQSLPFVKYEKIKKPHFNVAHILCLLPLSKMQQLNDNVFTHWSLLPIMSNHHIWSQAVITDQVTFVGEVRLGWEIRAIIFIMEYNTYSVVFSIVLPSHGS